MNVLVLGATSVIGSHLAAAFAAGNNLLLAGRDVSRLREAANRCRDAGAGAVFEFPCDLGCGGDELIAKAVEWDPDVIVNAASASSRLRDDFIPFSQLSRTVMVDLLAPLDLVNSIAAHRSGRLTRIVFVSSVLAVVASPRRVIYGCLKRMQEQALVMFARSQPGVQVLIARIAKVIPPDGPSPDSARFASAVRRSFDQSRNRMSFGWSGRLMTALFFVQPWAFALAVRLIRSVRQRREESVSTQGASGH
jgi:nucleoside-diphosphate-sugar epimerase